MQHQNTPDWAAIRRAYEADREPVARLSERHGVAVSALYWRARVEGWMRRVERRRLMRGPAGRRRVMIDRLFGILEQEVQMIESALVRAQQGDGVAAPAEGERRLRSVASAMRALDKLIQFDQGQEEGKQESQNYTEADAERLRRDLARRLQHLRSERGS